MENMSIFVERLNEYIQDGNLNVTTLSKKINFNRVTVSGILNGAHTPSTDIFIALIEFFNCSADYLLGLLDVPKDIAFKPVKPLGDMLKICLKESGKTQSRLREDLNLSSSLTYRWLYNISTPTVENYIRLAEYFGCGVDYLLGRES